MQISQNRILLNNATPIKYVSSPNQGGPLLERAFIIIHYSGGPTLESAVEWMTDPASQSAAHLVIGRDGSLVQLVPFDTIALHAGEGAWGNYTELNNVSVGIELENAGILTRSENEWVAPFGHVYPEGEVIASAHRNFPSIVQGWQKYTDIQLMVLVEVVTLLMRRYGFREIIGHDDIAPKRKLDPGPAFPMEKLRKAVAVLAKTINTNQAKHTQALSPADETLARAAAETTPAVGSPDAVMESTPSQPTGSENDIPADEIQPEPAVEPASTAAPETAETEPAQAAPETLIAAPAVQAGQDDSGLEVEADVMGSQAAQPPTAETLIAPNPVAEAEHAENQPEYEAHGMGNQAIEPAAAETLIETAPAAETEQPVAGHEAEADVMGNQADQPPAAETLLTPNPVAEAEHAENQPEPEADGMGSQAAEPAAPEMLIATAPAVQAGQPVAGHEAEADVKDNQADQPRAAETLIAPNPVAEAEQPVAGHEAEADVMGNQAAQPPAAPETLIAAAPAVQAGQDDSGLEVETDVMGNRAAEPPAAETLIAASPVAEAEEAGGPETQAQEPVSPALEAFSVMAEQQPANSEPATPASPAPVDLTPDWMKIDDNPPGTTPGGEQPPANTPAEGGNAPAQPAQTQSDQPPAGMAVDQPPAGTPPVDLTPSWMNIDDAPAGTTPGGQPTDQPPAGMAVDQPPVDAGGSTPAQPEQTPTDQPPAGMAVDQPPAGTPPVDAGESTPAQPAQMPTDQPPADAPAEPEQTPADQPPAGTAVDQPPDGTPPVDAGESTPAQPAQMPTDQPPTDAPAEGGDAPTQPGEQPTDQPPVDAPAQTPVDQPPAGAPAEPAQTPTDQPPADGNQPPVNAPAEGGDTPAQPTQTPTGQPPADGTQPEQPPASPQSTAADGQRHYRIEELDSGLSREYTLKYPLKPVTLLPVPFVPLTDGSPVLDNGAAGAAAMLLRAYLNVALSAEEFYAEFSFANKFTPSVSEVRGALVKLGLAAEYHAALRPHDLISAMQADKPAVVLAQYSVLAQAGLTEKAYPGARFMLVVGMDIKNIYVHDLLYADAEDGTAHAYPLEIFEKAWREAANDLRGQGQEYGALIPAAGIGAHIVRKVRVNAALLNVRSGPGLNYPVVGVIRKSDVYSVLRESNGWGQIGSGRWCILAYTVPE